MAHLKSALPIASLYVYSKEPPRKIPKPWRKIPMDMTTSAKLRKWESNRSEEFDVIGFLAKKSFFHGVASITIAEQKVCRG
jgi:hypothetical protein